MAYYLWKLRNLGLKFLYSKAFFPQQENSIYLVDEHDAKFSLLFAEFSLGLTVKSRQQFLHLLSRIKPYMLPSQPSESHQLKIPVEMRQFRNTYTHGKNSFLTLLPFPEIRSYGNNGEMHSHVDVFDCLSHFLASGAEADNLLASLDDSLSKVYEPRQTKRANEIRSQALKIMKDKNLSENDVLISYYLTFSDDFDPTVSLVKANRTGVWVNQVSFGRSRDCTDMESGSTYVLNLAPKGKDHDNVLRMMYTQMDILRKGDSEKLFYAKENRMVVPIFFPMLKYTDQPERRVI